MNRMDLRESYFKWICSLIASKSKGISYKKLLRYLFDTDFIYILERDENRAIDGCDLRFAYGYYHEIPPDVISDFLDDRKCSMLEMMVALCNRIEENIMSDSDFGNRTSQWFWIMIKNLGLDKMTDSRFNLSHVSRVIDRFVHREYSPDGLGGLVHIPNCDKDLREVEIWYQVMWYLTESYF